MAVCINQTRAIFYFPFPFLEWGLISVKMAGNFRCRMGPNAPFPQLVAKAGEGIVKFLVDIQSLHGISSKPEGFQPIPQHLVRY